LGIDSSLTIWRAAIALCLLPWKWVWRSTGDDVCTLHKSQANSCFLPKQDWGYKEKNVHTVCSESINIGITCGSAFAFFKISMQIRIQIQRYEPMWIHGDPNPGQTL
jgi:hypothetical protein